MSTDAGHSDLQALHETHRSIASATSGLVSPPRPSTPFDKASRSALARPRVESFSSRVAMNGGHMVPSPTLRQTADPLHASTAWAKPTSRRRASKNARPLATDAAW